MNLLILSASAILGLQAAPPAPPAPAPMQIDIPLIDGTSGDPTCGARPALAQQATCVQTTQAAISDVLDRYDAAFQAQGWLAADGASNVVIYVKRRAAGGCDGFQVLAFAQDNAAPAPGAPAWLAFAAIPGDVCGQRPAAPATPPAQ